MVTTRKCQRSCLFLIAVVWTIMAAFYTMVSMGVQWNENEAQSQRHLLYTATTTREEVAHSMPVVDEDEWNNDEDEDELFFHQCPNPYFYDQNTLQDEGPKGFDPTHSEPGDEYRDIAVDDFCDNFDNHYQDSLESNFSVSHGEESFESLIRRLDSHKKKGKMIFEPLENEKHTPSWLLFYHEISQYSLFEPNSTTVTKLLKDMATLPVINVDNFEKGTQIKLLLTFKDGAQAVVKPMRFPREQETLPDHFYFNDFERHIAEIASFHLDRVLGFYRVPPTVGRVLSIEKDLNEFKNTSTDEDDVYISPAGNTCFYGDCEMYCDSNHPICGNPDEFEASLAVFLPGKDNAKHEDEMHPWARSYSKNMLSPWEYDDEFCEKVREEKKYREGRRMLDLMDVAVFDFLIGNMDRHDIDLFLAFGTDTSPILFDNGRGFGKSNEDAPSILTPIAQCCQIRLSTLAKIVKLYKGPQKLSHLMRTSLREDPLESVLTEAHLDALDRRVVAILNVVDECVDKAGSFEKVVIDDGH